MRLWQPSTLVTQYISLQRLAVCRCAADAAAKINSKSETIVPRILDRVLEAFKQHATVRFDDFARSNVFRVHGYFNVFQALRSQALQH